jgi:hypothetical protein
MNKLLQRFKWPSKKQKSVEITIGIDFGTVYTKAICQDDVGHCTAVEFSNPSTGMQKYLLPSRLEQDSKGNLKLVSDTSPNEKTALKIELLNNRGNRSKELPAIVFLALTLKHIRLWFLKRYNKEYKNTSIEWGVNLGVSTEDFNDTNLLNDFRQYLEKAWLLSCSPEAINHQNAVSVMDGNQTWIASAPLVYFDVLPELFAGTVGYAKSKMARDGTHFGIDIGGFTSDACAFTLQTDQDGDQIFQLLTASVQPHGTVGLTKHRHKIIEKYKLVLKKDIDTEKPDAFAQKDCIINYIEESNLRPELIEKIKADDSVFANSCKTQLLRCITNFSRISEREVQRGGQPLLLTGGGTQGKMYSKSIYRAQQTLFKDIAAKKPLELLPLQPGKDLFRPNLDPTDVFSRLSVAYGLSFQLPNLGTFKEAWKVKDMEQLATKTQKEMITKEQV